MGPTLFINQNRYDQYLEQGYTAEPTGNHFLDGKQFRIYLFTKDLELNSCERTARLCTIGFLNLMTCGLLNCCCPPLWQKCWTNTYYNEEQFEACVLQND
jgi:hypothetical protein